MPDEPSQRVIANRLGGGQFFVRLGALTFLVFEAYGMGFNTRGRRAIRFEDGQETLAMLCDWVMENVSLTMGLVSEGIRRHNWHGLETMWPALLNALADLDNDLRTAAEDFFGEDFRKPAEPAAAKESE